jgi:hypothetical protein
MLPTSPRGSSSTSPTSVVAAIGDIDSTPQEARHRRLFQLRWWSLPDIPIAPPRGPIVNVWLNLVPATRIFLATPTKEATAVNITTTSNTTSQEIEGKSFGEKFLGTYGSKNPEIILPL